MQKKARMEYKHTGVVVVEETVQARTVDVDVVGFDDA